MEQFFSNLSIQLPGLLFAIVFHEWSHAYVATKFGDNTAKAQGRLSLNPAVHLDPLGTVLFPLVALMMGGFMFGWARPVPIDARNFRNIKRAVFWVSFSGPGSNLLLAIISAFCHALLRAQMDPSFIFYRQLIDIFDYSLVINLVLAVFNFIPFPPLDGSKMVSSFLGPSALIKYEGLARYSFPFFLLLMFTGALAYVFNPVLAAGRQLQALFFVLLS